MDDLTIRTERLEKKQEELKIEIVHTQIRNTRILSTSFIYIIAFAIFLYLQLPLPYLFPDADLITRIIELVIILLVATAICIQVNLRISQKYIKTLDFLEKRKKEVIADEE